MRLEKQRCVPPGLLIGRHAPPPCAEIVRAATLNARRHTRGESSTQGGQRLRLPSGAFDSTGPGNLFGHATKRLAGQLAVGIGAQASVRTSVINRDPDPCASTRRSCGSQSAARRPAPAEVRWCRRCTASPARSSRPPRTHSNSRRPRSKLANDCETSSRSRSSPCGRPCSASLGGAKPSAALAP